MKKKNNTLMNIVLVLFFLLGISLMLYPAISNYWNSKTQSEAIVDYDKMALEMPKEDYTAYFEEANAYNQALAKLDFPLLDYKKVGNYDDILAISKTGMMGYLNIEKINLLLPIYHTTDESVLNVAVGHLEGSSFPVGGKNTHCVLSAHRGLPSAKLFTNLDHLELGDTFEISVLDRKYTYQVDQIKTVGPKDTKDITIVNNEDYCTLLTCTPYGINTHRLIVRGKRIEGKNTKQLYIVSEAFSIDKMIVAPIVAFPMLFLLMAFVLLKPVKNDVIDDIELL